MSFFVMKKESIASISMFLECLYYHGYDYFGFSMSESFKRILYNMKRKNDISFSFEIYNELYKMNIDAYKQRYQNKYYDDIPKFDYKYIHHSLSYTDEYYPKIEKWHYQMSKMIDCYLYQCSEGNVAERDLYKEIRKLNNTLKEFIVENNKEYREAAWG